MASSRLGAFIDFNSSSQISSPPAAAQNYKQGARPSTHELNEIRLQQTSKVAPKPMKPTTSGPSTPPPTPSVLENRPSTPPANDVTEWAADRTVTLWKTKWRLLSCCLVYFGNGMNDSAPGALIPYIEKHYGIGYAVVSLIFVTNALGFISAAPVTHAIESKLGRSKSYAFAMSLLVGSYVIIICQPPFPVVVACFFLLGFGMALSLALGNVYCANLPNSITALSCSHGSYGLGGTVAPLFATAMVSSGIRWSLFYTVSLTISLINLGFSWWAFLDFENDPPAESLQPTASRPAAHSEPLTRKRLVKMAIRNRTTLLGALFIFAYQGAEVSTSGWVVSFLISYRHGDPFRVGYVSAGFWAGITVGRFLLGYPAAKLGHKIAVVIMVAGAVAFQLMTWLIPNVVGEAVSVAILGLLLGPVYPSATAVFTQLLPRNMHITSLSFISALGSSGGAVSPFFTGILAQNVGTMVLHPICIGLYGVMATSWLLLPKNSKRSE
ncbi:putative MFS efflux transporter [Penicillium brasilianum]|uniref:Putative MFS efflux transporter n=1 Tax=Penicillium brasilianum TaxID=104259 RepID=A0A1S9RV21_PENBI|nr:putative MFS efflux transporter [Penicillium brasilianum]